MTFGERLRRAREARGLTRDQLAAASGVPDGTIQGYEIGRRAPSFANAVRLAAALGLTCLDFAGCEDVAREPPGRRTGPGGPHLSPPDGLPGRPRPGLEPVMHY